MSRLFGTDGIRGTANTDLTCETALGVGRAAAVEAYKRTGKKPVFLIGSDTRVSSPMLVSAFAAGLCSAGADAVTLGCLPTPAVSYLTVKYGADGAAVISASHNPARYNGIKLLGADGRKQSDAIEEATERTYYDKTYAPTRNVGTVKKAKSPIKDYTDHIRSCVKTDLSGFKIAVDCGNGAAAYTAKRIFAPTKAELRILNAKTDGAYINDRCGASDVRRLCEFVRSHGFDCGAAFDGDADRCILVDEEGEAFDGDMTLSALGHDMLRDNKLENRGIVGTVMSNYGFIKFCESSGIKFVCADVGDKYVAELMTSGGYVLGGEQSGHIILPEYMPTGDGQLTALMIFSLMKKRNAKLSKLSMMEKYPQVLNNVAVKEEKKALLQTSPLIAAAVKKAEAELCGGGRVLVRPSGTEPLIRVMAEGSDVEKIKAVVDRLCEIIKKETE